MKKSLIRTLIYGLVVGGLFVSSFVCFGVAKANRTTYKNANVEILKLQAQQKKEKDEEKKAEIQVQIDEYTTKKNNASSTYKGVATTAYILTISSLASFGVCLAISDKIKAKEEEEAGRS
ncbi:MAG: hypothetical protein IJQ67_01230 [Bacilli bacterium]|nr:hypothetical protein [Bacilli bacterium]